MTAFQYTCELCSRKGPFPGISKIYPFHSFLVFSTIASIIGIHRQWHNGCESCFSSWDFSSVFKSFQLLQVTAVALFSVYPSAQSFCSQYYLGHLNHKAESFRKGGIKPT